MRLHAPEVRLQRCELVHRGVRQLPVQHVNVLSDPLRVGALGDPEHRHRRERGQSAGGLGMVQEHRTERAVSQQAWVQSARQRRQPADLCQDQKATKTKRGKEERRTR